MGTGRMRTGPTATIGHTLITVIPITTAGPASASGSASEAGIFRHAVTSATDPKRTSRWARCGMRAQGLTREAFRMAGNMLGALAAFETESLLRKVAFKFGTITARAGSPVAAAGPLLVTNQPEKWRTL
jgi:hypothetical protein